MITAIKTTDDYIFCLDDEPRTGYKALKYIKEMGFELLSKEDIILFGDLPPTYGAVPGPMDRAWLYIDTCDNCTRVVSWKRGNIVYIPSTGRMARLNPHNYCGIVYKVKRD